MGKRLIILKAVLWSLVGVWFTVASARFLFGLGATTNMHDAAPWGIWIGLDVMAGVALAAGGFVIAGAVYILGLEKYRPLVRPAILTAFLGYIAVAIGLLHDIGVPWRIWHPLVFGQPQSVMFEVSLCVVFYLLVLALELAPVVLEHPLFKHPLYQRLLTLIKKFTIPLVIAGIILSTLHQSSLGSLFLIAPHRVHPLWYSPIIYVLFFISAIGLGLMTVIMEALVCGWFLGHRPDLDRLSRVSKIGAIVLLGYTVLRIGDLLVRGAFSAPVSPGLGFSFFLEVVIGTALPAVMLALPGVRRRVSGLLTAGSLVIFGIVLNRLNLSIIAFSRPAGHSYFPGWIEIAVTAGLVAGAALVFFFFVERFNVYGDVPHQEKTKPDKALAGIPSWRTFSLFFTGGALLACCLLPTGILQGAAPRSTLVTKPNKGQALVIERTTRKIARVALLDTPRRITHPSIHRIMILDGNRSDRRVIFTHRLHTKRSSDHKHCLTCHHMGRNKQGRYSSCTSCHQDMFEPTDTFNHDRHVRHLGEKKSCETCHQNDSGPRTRSTAKSCITCHVKMADPKDKAKSGIAGGYMNIMHRLCLDCHKSTAAKWPKKLRTAFTECSACH